MGVTEKTRTYEEEEMNLDFILNFFKENGANERELEQLERMQTIQGGEQALEAVEKLIRNNIKAKSSNGSIIPLDKITRGIFTNKIKSGNNEISTGKNVTTYVFLGYDKNIEVELTLYEKRIYASVLSLIESGIKEVSLNRVYQESIQDQNATAGAATIKKISEAILKISSIKLKIDNTQDVERTDSEKYPKYKALRDISYIPLLNIKCLREITYEGNQKTAGVILESAPLFEYYTEPKQQYTTLSKSKAEKFIKLKSIKRLTDNIIAIQEYLMNYVLYKNNKFFENGLKWETIFSDLHIEEPAKQTRTRATVKNILADWKENGAIADFTATTKKITVVRI